MGINKNIEARAEAKLVPYLAGLGLAAPTLLFDTLERGSGKEKPPISFVKCYSFRSGTSDVKSIEDRFFGACACARDMYDIINHNNNSG